VIEKSCDAGTRKDLTAGVAAFNHPLRPGSQDSGLRGLCPNCDSESVYWRRVEVDCEILCDAEALAPHFTTCSKAGRNMAMVRTPHLKRWKVNIL